MGRKTKLTPELIKNAEKLLKGGNYTRTVCEYLGIHESTWYKWMQEGEQATRGIKKEFFETVKKSEAEAEIRLLNTLQKIAEEERTWQCISWIMERKWPERWGRKDRVTAEVEHKGEIHSKQEREISIKKQIEMDPESKKLAVDLWRRQREIRLREEMQENPHL